MRTVQGGRSARTSHAGKYAQFSNSVTSEDNCWKAQIINAGSDYINRPTHLKIKRTLRPLLADNPYVFKPKSYGRRRSPPPSLEQPPKNKKAKKNVQPRIAELIVSQGPSKQLKFIPVEVDQQKLTFSLPITQVSTTQQSQNGVTIMIVDNENRRQTIVMNHSLVEVTTTTNGKQQLLASVPNPMNISARDKCFKSLNFRTDYRGLYGPARLQQGNDKSDFRGSRHFIRRNSKGFTQAKTCGVSYIKPSESPSLPPLIFQCSSQCKSPSNESMEHLARQLFYQQMIVVKSTETQMRDLLLGQPVGTVGLGHLSRAWQLLENDVFLLYVPGVVGPDLRQEISKSFVKIGLLCKKGICSRKSVFQSLGVGVSEGIQEKVSPPEDDVRGRLQILLKSKYPSSSGQIMALSIKIQLYVQKEGWHSLEDKHKQALNSLIQQVELLMVKNNLSYSYDRLSQKKIQTLPFKIPSGRNQQGLQSDPSLPFALVSNYKTAEQVGEVKFSGFPLYFISTRDSFSFDLRQEVTELILRGRKVKKVTYSFDPGNLPGNYHTYQPEWGTRVGVTNYFGLFDEQELARFEQKCYQLERMGFRGTYLHDTVQPTIGQSKVRRTKFFFGYRYMWTRSQLSQPYSYVAAGVRRDVSPIPEWFRQIERGLVESGVTPPEFINSVALNVYHDGKQGLAQHFDDAVRFKQPIFSLRLFSDARLSFGNQYYGFCNGAFSVPLPRGGVCVLEQGSFAANGVKHCVRPADMSGKSAAVILRQIHSQVIKDAHRYDQLVDFPSWLSTLSTEANAVSYAAQKKREAEWLDHKEK